MYSHIIFLGFDESFKDAFKGTSESISDIGYAFYGGLWAYDGWNNLNYVTEELKNPIRDLPLAIMIGIPLVTGCYVMVNIAYLTVLTSAEIASSNAVAVVSYAFSLKKPHYFLIYFCAPLIYNLDSSSEFLIKSKVLKIIHSR